MSPPQARVVQHHHAMVQLLPRKTAGIPEFPVTILIDLRLVVNSVLPMAILRARARCQDQEVRLALLGRLLKDNLQDQHRLVLFLAHEQHH